MKNYLKLLNNVLNNGWNEQIRVFTPDGDKFDDVRVLHGAQLRFVLGKGFPLLTVRPVEFDAVRERAIKVLFGSNSDVVVKKIQEIAWQSNVLTDDGEGHCLELNGPTRVQFTTELNFVHCQVTLDSINVVSELPELIATYAIIVTLLSRESIGKYDGELVINIGRAEVLHKQFPALNELVNRKPLKLPSLTFNPDRSSFKDCGPDDLVLEDYLHNDVTENPIKP